MASCSFPPRDFHDFEMNCYWFKLSVSELPSKFCPGNRSGNIMLSTRIRFSLFVLKISCHQNLNLHLDEEINLSI